MKPGFLGLLSLVLSACISEPVAPTRDAAASAARSQARVPQPGPRPAFEFETPPVYDARLKAPSRSEVEQQRTAEILAQYQRAAAASGGQDARWNTPPAVAPSSAVVLQSPASASAYGRSAAAAAPSPASALPRTAAPANAPAASARTAPSEPSASSSGRSRPAVRSGTSSASARGSSVVATPSAAVINNAAAGSGAQAGVCYAPRPQGGAVSWLPVLCPDAMNVRKVYALQQALKRTGNDPGPIDGKLGPLTMAALNGFRRARGLPLSNEVDVQSLQALGITD